METLYYQSSDDKTWESYNSATLITGVEFGRMIAGPASLMITPHLGTDYFFLHGEAFNEQGTNLQRSFGSVNYSVVEIPIGLRVAKTFRLNGDKIDRLRTNMDLSYVRSVGNGTPSAATYYRNDPSAVWTTTGTSIGRDALRLNLGLNGRFFDRIDTELSYQLETRRQYTSHQLNAALVTRW